MENTQKNLEEIKPDDTKPADPKVGQDDKKVEDIPQEILNKVVEERLARQEVKHQKKIEEIEEIKSKEIEEIKSSKDSALAQELKELKEMYVQDKKETTVKNFVSTLKNNGIDDSTIAILTATVDIDKMADFDASALAKVTNVVSIKTPEENSKLDENPNVEDYNPYEHY